MGNTAVTRNWSPRAGCSTQNRKQTIQSSLGSSTSSCVSKPTQLLKSPPVSRSRAKPRAWLACLLKQGPAEIPGGASVPSGQPRPHLGQGGEGEAASCSPVSAPFPAVRFTVAPMGTRKNLGIQVSTPASEVPVG